MTRSLYDPFTVFSKTLIKPKEFKNAGFSFPCGKKKHFENGALGRFNHDNHMISPKEVFLKQKSKMTGDCFVFTGVVWAVNI